MSFARPTLLRARIFSTVVSILPLTFAFGCAGSEAQHDEPATEDALESTANLTAKDFSLVQGTVSGSASKMFNEIAELGPGNSVYAGLSGSEVGFGPDRPLGGSHDDMLEIWGVQCTTSKCKLNAIVLTKDIGTGLKTKIMGGGTVTLRGKIAKDVYKTLKEHGRTESGGISCEERSEIRCKVEIKTDLAMITLLEQRGEELGMKIAKAFFPEG